MEPSSRPCGVLAPGFVERARDRGIRLYAGVPCSTLEPLLHSVRSCPDIRYVAATNEGDAVAVAAGAALGGRRCMVLMQNSGLGNAVNPLTSLHAVFGLPVLMVVTLRGAPGEPPDEPQHRVMGPLTTRLLDSLEVPWAWFPRTEEEVGEALDRALASCDRGSPYALVMPRGALRPEAPPAWPGRRERGPVEVEGGPGEAMARDDVLRCVRDATRPHDVIVATTGYTGRALYALGDHPRHFYMVGSMGCASSLGLGLALACPERRVIVLDGDGAVLMRMGALAMLGHEAPPNLVHVVLDNGCYESTGGQATAACCTDLAAVAAACGYPRVVRASSVDRVEATLRRPDPVLTFLHVSTSPSGAAGLPRPTVTPPQVARRLAGWVQSCREAGPSGTGEELRSPKGDLLS